MKTTSVVRAFTSAMLLWILGSSFAAAQLFPGRITGVVRDAQGAVVAGANVKLSNPATGQERTIVSDSNGEFNFPQLPVGTFQLTVTKEGFRTTVINDVVTAQGQVNNVDPVLAIGTVTSEIEVSSSSGLIQTETNEVGGQLTQIQVESLPIGNSDYTRLALTLPGVTQNSNFAFAQYTINGSRARSNGFNIDGVSNTDPSTYLPAINEGGNSATGATRLPLDAIQEVTVSANAGADSGQNSGSVMNVIVKSGTNRIHGSLYELHRDSSLDAANFFENLHPAIPPAPHKAPFVWNEFGGTIGGPIVIPHLYDGRDRTFFFAGYDGSRLRLGTTLNGIAPTPADIATATGLVEGQNITPNQLGLNILQQYASLGLSGPFTIGNRGRQTPNSGVLKIDHNFSTVDSLSARYLHGTGEDEFPGGGPGPGGGSQLGPWFGVTPTVADNFAISEIHIFNPRLIHTLRLGWNRFSQFQKGRDANVNPATIGFNTGVGPESYGMPEVDTYGYANLGLQYGAGGRVATSYQIADEVNWTRSKHAWKLGFNFLHNYSNYTLAGGRGIFSFTGSQLGGQLGQSGALASLVDLIAGFPSPGPNLTQITRVGSDRANISQNVISGYGVDTVKLTPRLTLVAGLRYDFFTTVHESRNRFSAFDPTLGLVQASQLPGGHLYNAPKGNFGPRVSLAWQPPFELLPGKQTVVRAGFGIYYDTIPLTNFEEGLAQNPVGPTAGFTIVPLPNPPQQPQLSFGVGVPIFGTGAPQPPFNITSIQHNLKTPNVQEWNFNIQQELADKVVFQIGYVGNHSIHQLQLLDINQPPEGAGFGPGCNFTPGSPTQVASGDPACEQAARPYNAKFPTLSQINTISSAGFATYHALQALLKTNAFHGLTTQFSFTWSHNMDTASEVEDFFGTSGYVPQDSTNLKGSYANSEFDQRRAFIFTYVYAIPFPKAGGALAYLAKDWQLSGTTTLRDGFATPLLTFSDESGVGNNRTRYDCIGPIHYQLKDFSQPYASPSSFAEPASGTFGNCPRNPLIAPGLKAWDISLQRAFKLGERVGFEFRTSFFNAFNHPNFAEPQPGPNGSTLITASADDGSFDSHFGVGGPRNIQFQARISW